MTPNDLYSVILSHPSRPALAAGYWPLAEICLNPDQPLPSIHDEIYHPDFPLTWGYRNPSKLAGVFNCFLGHLKCLRMGLASGKPLIAVYEDDCTPGPGYDRKLNELLRHWPADKCDVLNFQGRGIGNSRCGTFAGFFVVDPLPRPDKNGVKWCCGALHYIITRETALRVVEWHWTGMPIDIRLTNETRMLILDPSPVIHDRSQGSIIEA